MMIQAQWDPFHRAWNDIKGALKSSRFKAWKVVLQLTLVANLPYGPYGTSQWFYRKLAKMREFLATRTVDSTSWLQLCHLICRERRQPEPRDREGMLHLFSGLGSLRSFTEKGPLVKLMRWFSWFESMSFY